MKINFDDHTLSMLVKETGLSWLEIKGVIACINQHLPSEETDARRRRDEQMGRDIY